MSPVLDVTRNDLVSWKPLRGKKTTLGAYERRRIDFKLAKVPGSSFWPGVWAILLNHCRGKHVSLRVDMGHLTQAEGDWTVRPITVTIDPKATVANMAIEGVYEGNLAAGGERSFHFDTMVGDVANGETAEEDLLSVVAQNMAQWDLVLTLVVTMNKKSTEHRAYFVYGLAQIPTNALVQLADLFLRVMDYVNQYGLDVPLGTVLEFIGESGFALPLYRRHPSVELKQTAYGILRESQLERVVASAEQTRIWMDSQKCDHTFYHLVVLRLQESIDFTRLRHTIHQLTQWFPILVNRFVDQQRQVFRYEATDTSDLVRRVTIDEALLGKPDQLRSLLHDIHRLDSVDRPLFSVVELVPNGSDHIAWLSVYCHYVLGDQAKFSCWVEKLRNLINDPSALPFPVFDVNDSGGELDPTEFWKTHFPDGSLDLDLSGQRSQRMNPTCPAHRYEPIVPGSLVSHLSRLMESLSIGQLELFQAFMALFLLRLARKSSVALFGQADHNSWVPWVAQAADEASVEDALHSLTVQYRQSTQYDWSEFIFSKNSGKPSIRVTAIPMLPEYIHDFSQPYALTPLSLTWLYGDDNTVLKLVVNYDSGMYQVATIERLVQNFLFFVSQCCIDISQDWRKVEVVHPDEQRVLLHEFVTTKHDYDPYDSVTHDVLDLFLSNVRKYPESVVVECSDHQETYRSLYSKVGLLMTHFHFLGIQRQERIAVIVESNVFTIMTILALWTLGAVYVPIDSQLPQERQQYMMETADCTQVLSTTSTKPDWVETIAIQDILAPILLNKDHVALPDITTRHPLDDIAYIVFTSGTTGQPKGITIHYGAFNNLLAAQPLLAQDCPVGSRWLLTVGVAFDAYLYGMLLSMCHGWTLVLTSNEIIMDVLPTIHCILTTPSYISSLQPECYPNLRMVLLGGEIVPQTLADRWASHCHLYNGYGPSEITVVATMKEVKPGDQVTIGRPLPNYECYILDNQMKLVPIGVVGEIFIGGPGVSKGYINRPDLNQKRFLPNPFAAGRLYCTGDYGRWLSNGEIDFLGRIDDQVKLRGFRVELSEVRGALLKQPGVRDAFVMVVDKKLLVGFIISEAGISICESVLREVLGEHLPHYMVPHHVVVIQDQPGFLRTVNGKVDQQCLLKRLDQHLANQQEVVRKSKCSVTDLSEKHQLLCEVLANVLGLNKACFGLERSFVQLGGDSISAIQVSSKCRQSGWSLGVSVIMKNQPIQMTADAMTPTNTQSVIERPMVGYGVHFPLTPVQQWFFGLPMKNHHRLSMSLLAELTQTISVDILSHALHRLVDHHDMLRGSFSRDDDHGSWSQRAMPAGTATYYPEVQALTCPDVDSLNTVTVSVQCGMNITHGPFVGAALVTTEDTSVSYLYLTVHHVVIDLISWSILMEDLHQLIRDPLASLEDVGYSFMDWTVGVAERVVPQDPADDDEENQHSEWFLPVVGPDIRLSLNTEANAYYRTVTVSHSIASVLLHPETYPMGQNVQPIELLLTALGQALATVATHPTVTIYNESHGRHPWSDDIDVSRTIGWFTTVTAVRINSVEVQSTSDWVRQVKLTLRSAPSFAPVLTLTGNPPEVVFNFVGNTTSADALACQGQAPWVPRLDLLPNHPTADPHEPRAQVLEITGTPMGNGELEFTFVYCPQVVSHNTMDHVIKVLKVSLSDVARYHQFNQREPYYTSNDFSLLHGVPLTKLDEALQEISRLGWTKEPTDLLDMYPMLPMQQGLLSISARDPSQYIVQFAMTITGVSDSESIHQALTTLVTRYDILRTRFLLNWSHDSISGLQVVTRDTHFPWTEIRNWEDVGATSEQDFMHQQYQAGLDVASDALFGFTVKRLDTDSFRLILLMHHALLDGWSGGVMINDLKSLLSDSEILDINSSSGRFRDFVEHYYEKDLSTSKDFWTRYLQGVHQATHLTLPRPAPSLKHLVVQEHRTVLTSDISQLQRLLTPVGVTLYSLIKATWALVLSRYTGQLDVVFANTVSGRSLDVPGVESMVGCLINTLPCRIVVDGNPSVVDFLRLIEQEGNQLVAHEHCPIPLINSWLESTLDCHVNDLFNTFLVLGNFPVMNTEDDRVRIIDVVPVEFTEYAVTVMVDFFEQDLVLRINYDQRKYDDAYAARIYDCFVRVFNGLVDVLQQVNMSDIDDSGCLVSEVPLFSAKDWTKLTQSMPAPTCTVDTTLCVHEVLRREAQEIGDRVAIKYGDNIQWTYAELYQRSRYIAYGLLANGVKREEPVGLVIDRQPSAIAAMFGILMAGAAYVPMNADFPLERVRFIVQDCNFRFVLTNTDVELDEVQVLDIDTLMDQPATESPLPEVQPSDLSHIIYTSGTTGNPKGVQQEHRTVANYVQQPEEVLGLVPGLRMMQSMSLASDCSTIEVFGGLCNGVTLVLRTDMLDTLAKVDTVMLTPSVLATIDPSRYPNITRALVGGEALPLQTAEKWARHCRLFNVYGPSECFATHAVEYRTGDSVTIGRVIGNIEAYILDDQLRPVPFGVPGEICLGGIGLTRGYVNRPELNRNKFVTNPFHPDSSRLYRSGDIGRWLLNGTVEYFARKDDQVKIRGYRVEPQEIESVLLECPGIVSAAVLPHDGKLYGFCSPENADILKIKEYLDKRLPSYMVPQDVFSLESIPLTAVGKIDKHSLRTTLKERLAHSDERAVKGPANPIENAIHEAMGETLNIPLDYLDVRDSIFQLGGDSISAIRFSSLCRERGIQLSIAQIFRHKSVASLGKFKLLDYGSKSIPTEMITFVVAEEILSPLVSFLSSVVQSISIFNSRYDLISRQLVFQSHPAVVIDQDLEASYRLNPTRGVWLSGMCTRHCKGLKLVTLVAHRVPLGRVGGWSTILQGVVKQCPKLVAAPESSSIDTHLASVSLKHDSDGIHHLTVPYSGNPFSDGFVYNGLHIPLSVIILAGYLMALRQFQGFDSVGIFSSGYVATWDTEYLEGEESTNVVVELQRIKNWYYDHLLQGESSVNPEALVLYHHSDVTQSHGVFLVEQHAPFWITTTSIQATVIYQPRSLVLQLCHGDWTIAESLLIAWKSEVNRLLDIPNQLRDTEHAFIPADFPHLVLTSDDLDELVSEIHQDLGIPPAAIHDVYPLSTMQQNLVVNTLRDSTSYIVQHVFRITGVLNLAKYRSVWDELGKRHTILRTKFLVSRMVQVVTNCVDIDWVVSDTPLSSSEMEYQHTVRQLGFDLSGGHPLLRIHLFPDVDGQGWLCFLAIHHAVIDGWSYQLLMSESLALYHGVPLTAEVPYRRFIDSVSTRDTTADKAYWTEALEGLQSTPDLPFPQVSQVGLYRKDAVVLNRTEPLHHLCRTWGITFNVLLRGVWALGLTQYLGKPNEVTFGVMISGRDGQINGLDRLVGPTINTLPFRVKVDPQQSVVDWLQGLAEQSTQLLEHEQTSLVDIKHWIGLDKNDQLFRSMIAVGRYLESGSSVQDSLIEYHSLTGYNDTEYPLMASFDEPVPGESLHLTIMANHEPFYVDGLVDCIGHLLSQLAKVDSALLFVETLLQPSPTALSQVQEWIPGPIVTSCNPNVVMASDLFTQHLAQQPHRVALETKDEQYTYRECYVQACWIGRALLDHGLQPGDKVALLFTRSAHYLLAILGTWLVGGVAVPMDATNASTRLQSMVDSLGEGSFLMTRTANDSGQVLLPDFYTAKVVVDNMDHLPHSTINLPPSPRDHTVLALIIHTSGTTGVPKGVMLRHESIINYISYVTQLMSLPATCRFLQALNITFDGYFVETLSTWLVGGTLVLHDGELVDDMKRVTHCGLTPSLLGVLNPENYPEIEAVFCGGEALSYTVTNNWLAAGKHVLNLYGPSETTIASHVDTVSPNKPISIGRPISNTMCYILDDQLNLVPPGVPGQIGIAGIGVSNGYWKRPDLTAKTFIDNPFSPGKMYLTGDLGCWLPNGKVHYIGRKDNQVKLRGFRIELGEVESWCERVDSTIQQAVALVVNKQLVAFVSPQSVDVNEVTQALKRALPYYMVPTHIILLDGMPKTPNGKVDRRALAEYPLPQILTDDITYVDNASEFSDTYQLVARLALQALRFPEAHPLPAPSTSFFTMGGDSISAVSFSTLCRKQGLNVAVAKVFTLQTLGAISAYCKAKLGMKKVTLKSPSLTHFQRWLTEERGLADMVVEVQDTDQPVRTLKQPLGFTSANEWQNVLKERNSIQLKTDLPSELISTTETGTTVEWSISPLVYPMFTTDKLYGQYQCTLSEALLTGFLLAWRKTQHGNVDVDLFRLKDNELVNTNWQQDTLADASLSPLAWLQRVKQVVRNADWSDISNCDNDHPRVLFHMVDPVLGKNIVQQRQQRLLPLLGARRQYTLEVMMWYQIDGTITLVIYEDSLRLSGDEEKFGQVLPSLWKDAMNYIVECNAGTAWLPSDFPLVSFEYVQQLTVNPTNMQTVWPLSSLQQGFVIESLKDPSAYMVQLIYEFQGALDVDRYHQAWLTVGQRHDAMRVQFHPDQSVQVVMSDFNLEWDYEQTTPEAEITDYLLRMRQRGFTDITNEPLFRIQLLKQSSILHLCFITAHHAILDAWSIDIVLEEVRRVYQGLPLTNATVSYGHFLEHVTKTDTVQSQSFWETYLKSMEPTPDLPLPKSENSPTESATDELTPSLTSVRAWCNKLGITINSLVRGLWALLLGRYLGKETREVTFGVMVTGRDGDIDGIDEMVGLSVNTVPFRVTLDPTQSVQSWLQAIHTQSGELMSHSYVGLLDIEMWANQRPLFQSMLVNTKSRARYMKDLSVITEEKLRWVNKGGYNQVDYPLTVSFAENGDFGGLQLHISGKHGSSYYSSMVAYLNTVLGTLVGESPSADKLTVGDLLDQIPPSELERIQTWSQGKNIFYDGKPRLVHDLVIEGKSQSQLDIISLMRLDPTLEVTYHELITQAQLVAQRLLALDCSNRFVIQFFERSPTFVMSILGTLMAGKTCVPMDAAHTSERLIGMNQSLGEVHPVVLTSHEYRAMAEKLFGGSIICVDDLARVTPGSLVTSDWNPPRIAPTDLAFVYFTSGSTGKPKAVPARHESISMNIGFDSSLLELFTTFYTGGTVVLQSDDLIDSLGKVDACMLTPSMLQAVGDPLEYPDLRVVVTAGEPLPFSLAEKWCQVQGRQVQLFNTYGPTETVVTSHFEHVTVTPNNSLVTIGRTIPNVQCYILDDTLRMVPIGVIGEICIGGMGVCNSYLNDEQRSRDVFVPNPLGSGMLYRTGDLGCWLTDGRVYCMGRKDNQVKMRGFRIELGEVESAVYHANSHIKQAVALVKQGQLVVYFTSTNQREVSIVDLLERLSKALPSFMVPDYVVPIVEIPHTVNGKVDRKQLAALTLDDLGDNTAHIQYDLSPAEEIKFTSLRDLIKDILRLPDAHPPIYPGSSFFKLGGDSITAIQLSARGKRELGLDLNVRDIFLHQGILGALVVNVRQPSESSMVPVNADINVTCYPCTPLQTGMISAHIKDQTAYILQAIFTVGASLDVIRFQRAWSVVVETNPTLRTRFNYDEVNKRWVQVIMEHIELEWLLFTDKEKYLAQDYQRGFTVDGPFIRFGYHPDKQQCVLTMHHSITDGWSSGLIFEQVVDTYHKLTEGRLVSIKVDHGYAQFAHYVTNQPADMASEFWQHELHGVTEGTLLSAGASTNSETNEDSVRYVMGDFHKLTQYIQQSGITLSTLLRAAWALILRQYTGREKDVIFGVVVSGRNVPVTNVDRIVGLCINTIPCRVTLEKHQTVESLIKSVHQGSIRTHGYDYYPLSDVHKWSGFPANQDMFNTLLVVENLPFQSGGDLDWKLDSMLNPTEYPLTVLLFPTQDQLEVVMNYHTSEFPTTFVQQMLEDFVRTLLSLLIDPSKSLVDLPVHVPASDTLIFNPADYPVRHAHYYMEQQIQETPDHPALYDLPTDQEFTYRQLDTLSHYAACMLASAVESDFVKADQIVGIVARSTPGLVIAQLAIWKLGLAFVVIDLEYSLERIKFIVSDTQCIAWIGYGREPPCSVPRDLPWISLDGLTGCLLSTDPLPSLPLITIDPHDLAYVVYTSGSTGQPKGVMVEHGSVAHYLYTYQTSVANVNSQTISPLLVSPTFDAAIGEIWTSLSFGGMVLLTQEKPNFERALKRATRALITPTLLSYFDPCEYPLLQQVVIGGETFDLSLIRKWQQCGIPQIVNGYGPCEVPIASHCKIYDQGDVAKVVSVGQPLPGYKGVILDSWMTPMPVGVIGEMWLGGQTVARGYLHREELTRERFVDNPTWGRLYRTGDLARWLPGGDVEVLGCVDNQVKVHGFRVELEEVERVILASATGVGRVCVAYDRKKKILVGFVTPEDVNVDQVMDDLQDRAPQYMIPNTIVPLADFPLSHDGKADRKALLALPRRNNVDKATYLSTPMEIKLVTILADVLRVNPATISPHNDTFFTLGGNSISAMHFVSRCKNNGIQLKLVDINRQATIAALAKRACEGKDKFIPDAQFNKHDHGPFTLSPVQRMYFSWDLTDLHQWPLPLLMKITAPRTLDEWKGIVATLVSHHDMMRARINLVDGEWHGRVLCIAEDLVKLNQVTLADETDHWRVITEANRTMNFTTGPIYLTYVMNYQDTQYFYLALHHLITDNMSMNLLAEYICTLLNGQPLPEKTLSYSTWSQNLDGLRKVISVDPYELPREDELVLPPVDVDPMQHSESSQRLGYFSVQLDVATTLALDQFGHRDTSAEDIILTSLLLAYTEVFNCTSIPLQCTSHGRNALGNPWDVSNTVGFFVNVCPIVLRRKERDNLETTLDGVRSILRGVSDFAIRYMLGGYTMKAPIAYNFLGKHAAVVSHGTNGVEVIDINTSDEFQRQRVNKDLVPLIFFAKYIGDCLTLMVSYKSSRYSAECMSTVVEKWENGVRCVMQWLKSQE
ncbi:Nonribosomal peptide synthetase [Dispira simplex]|nr:Nonribosomal peptide synthetase [Dispira simplex]